MPNIKYLSFITIFLSLILFFYGCMSLTSGVSSSYDEFTGNKMTQAKVTLATTFPLGWYHLIAIEEITATKDKSYWLVFNYTGKDWFFFDHIYFIIDGQRYEIKALNPSRDVTSTGVSEWVSFPTDLDFIKKIAYAKDIKFKVTGSKDDIEYTLDEDEQLYYKTFLSKIQ